LGPKLPYKKTTHCQITINSTHVFFGAGGKETFLLNFPAKEWHLMKNMPVPLFLPACGLLNNSTIGPGKKKFKK